MKKFLMDYLLEIYLIIGFWCFLFGCSAAFANVWSVCIPLLVIMVAMSYFLEKVIKISVDWRRR